MARGTQLQQLVYMLRAEIRRSTKASVGVDDLPDLKQKLNKQYAIQRERYNWPFLRYRFILPLKAAQQYYDMPSLLTSLSAVPNVGTPSPPPSPPTTTATNMSHRHIWRVASMFGNIPMKIERGIDFEEYALFDFEQYGVTSDPVTNWDIIAASASKTQIEVWPVPASDTNYLRFYAGVETPAMVNDTDLCWLDDMLVVMYAAADCLALDMSETRVGLPPAAQLQLTQAEAYYATLIAGEVAQRETVAIGQGRPVKTLNTDALIRIARTP